jgi:hypothetical protein
MKLLSLILVGFAGNACESRIFSLLEGKCTATVRQSLGNVHMEYTFVNKQRELVVNISGEFVAPVLKQNVGDHKFKDEVFSTP